MGLKVKRKGSSKSGGKFYIIDGSRIERLEPSIPSGVKMIRRLRGEKTEMGQFEFRIYLFQVNEARSGARKKGNTKVSKPFTDDQLGSLMAAEFPTGAACHYQVQTARRQYNDGVLTQGVKPKITSRRFNSDGDAVAISRGRPSLNDVATPVKPVKKKKKKKTARSKK